MTKLGTLRKVTIRETDQAERDTMGAARQGRLRYVCVNPATGDYRTVFGMVQGGHSKAAAVFWAERLASKNGLAYEPPPGWETIEGKL